MTEQTTIAHNYKTFVEYFKKLLEDINRYCPNNILNEYIINYDKLIIEKVLVKYHNLTSKCIAKINAKDNTLFDSPFVILPNVDLSEFWPNLSSGQKNKLWIYLKMLHVESEHLVTFKPAAALERKMTIVTKKDEKINFNPYVGIGGDNVGNIGVNEICDNIDVGAEDYSGAPGLETIINMFGIDKVLNQSNFAEEIKKLQEGNIDAMTDSIKQMFSSDVNQKTTDMMNDILSDLSTEFKTANMNPNKPGQGLAKIAGNVIKKTGQKYDKEDIKQIDLKGLLSSTSKMVENITDDKGNKVFGEGNNPLNMIQSVLGNVNKNTTKEEYINTCNNVLKQMGVANPNVENMMNNPMVSSLMKNLKK